MKAKKILWLLVMLFGVHNSNAQDKYMYSQICYSSYYESLYISIDGKEFQVEKVDLPKMSTAEKGYNANPLLKKITELENAGWELTGREMPGTSLLVAYLRKKK